MRKIESHLVGMGGILGVIIFTPSLALANFANFKDIRECSARLLRSDDLDGIVNKIRVINTFSRYSIESLGRHRGYFLRYLGGNAQTPTHTMSVPEVLNPWKREVWLAEGNEYQTISVGFRGLEPYMDALNSEIVRDAELYPGQNLEIKYSPQFTAALDNLSAIRDRMHDAVLTKYDDVKGYLRRADLTMLSWANDWSDNSDVFGLFRGPFMSPEEMTWQDIHDRLAITMQVTYFGKRDFWMPGAWGTLDAWAARQVDPSDRLPFQFRLTPESTDEVAAKVYARFDRRFTCELMRFARFDRDGPSVPERIYNRFLLQILKTVEKRGMKYLLASTDKYTSRLFAQYGFRKFMQLPSQQSSEKEFLCYLEIGTLEYRAVIEKLERKVEEGMGNAKAD